MVFWQEERTESEVMSDKVIILEPCPFCGKTPELWRSGERDVVCDRWRWPEEAEVEDVEWWDCFYLECPECVVETNPSVSGNTAQQAINKWNYFLRRSRK